MTNDPLVAALDRIATQLTLIAHRRAHDPQNGPPYCECCSNAIGEWIQWPCPAIRGLWGEP